MRKLVFPWIAFSAALALSAALLVAGCGPGQVKPPARRLEDASLDPQAVLSSIHMVSESTGWALSGNSLLWTVDGGRCWEDVTPPGAQSADRGIEARFLDPMTGWVVAVRDGEPMVTVFTTADGGLTWRGVEVVKKTGGGLIYGASLAFVDLKHGWLMIEPEHGMSSRPGELYATSDGGEHWSLVSSTSATRDKNGDEKGRLPFGGPFGFRDVSAGWLAGRLGAGFTPDHPLYISLDGGRTWQPQDLALPSGYSDGRLDVVSAPVFFPPQHLDGLLTATLVPASHKATEYATVIYVTRDGGRTWQSLPPIRPEAIVEFIDARNGWTWRQEPRDSGSTAPVKGCLYRTVDGGRSWAEIAPDEALGKLLQDGYAVEQVDFVTEKAGWILLSVPRLLPKSPEHPNPRATVLLRTVNGGYTWSPIEPQLVRKP
ncbi:MAG: hypothetical protein HPY55_04425 [Firmicutes bacterium]|nr:hypothetical protein [Bacillota bacterium]